MNQSFAVLLERDYTEDRAWQAQNQAEAEQARQAGDLDIALDLSLHTRLPDTCWALERYAEARRWYRHNAHILTATRAWHSTNSGPDYPLEELLDLEASTLARAGDRAAAGPAIERAYAYWHGREDGRLVVSRLSLHAAQIGLPQFSADAAQAITARATLPGADGAAEQQLRAQLAYEPAQVQLLLGAWDGLAQALEPLIQARTALANRTVFEPPLQSALLAAGEGLRQILALYRGETTSSAAARAACEEAMAGFYRFSGGVEHNVYFMRLNTLLADDLAAGRAPDPNPFASDRWAAEEA
jgi:hypothetical protein